MRQITKDIQLTIDGNPISFRLTKLDAFSGVDFAGPGFGPRRSQQEKSEGIR